MKENKLTPEEIKKTLEDYIKENEFEYFHSNMVGEYPLIKKSLNLINCQQAEISERKDKCEKCGAKTRVCIESLQNNIAEKDAEIERLGKEIEALNYIIMQPYHEEKDKCEKCEKELRTKVVKEFWSKLKTHSRKMQSSDFSGEFWDKAILVADGDNILKEMVGEQG